MEPSALICVKSPLAVDSAFRYFEMAFSGIFSAAAGKARARAKIGAIRARYRFMDEI